MICLINNTKKILIDLSCRFYQIWRMLSHSADIYQITDPYLRLTAYIYQITDSHIHRLTVDIYQINDYDQSYRLSADIYQNTDYQFWWIIADKFLITNIDQFTGPMSTVFKSPFISFAGWLLKTQLRTFINGRLLTIHRLSDALLTFID